MEHRHVLVVDNGDRITEEQIMHLKLRHRESLGGKYACTFILYKGYGTENSDAYYSVTRITRNHLKKDPNIIKDLLSELDMIILVSDSSDPRLCVDVVLNYLPDDLPEKMKDPFKIVFSLFDLSYAIPSKTEACTNKLAKLGFKECKNIDNFKRVLSAKSVYITPYEEGENQDETHSDSD